MASRAEGLRQWRIGRQKALGVASTSLAGGQEVLRQWRVTRPLTSSGARQPSAGQFSRRQFATTVV
jgi:hypothetical protein